MKQGSPMKISKSETRRLLQAATVGGAVLALSVAGPAEAASIFDTGTSGPNGFNGVNPGSPGGSANAIVGGNADADNDAHAGGGYGGTGADGNSC
jgi:hypothetical protein